MQNLRAYYLFTVYGKMVQHNFRTIFKKSFSEWNGWANFLNNILF